MSSWNTQDGWICGRLGLHDRASANELFDDVQYQTDTLRHKVEYAWRKTSACNFSAIVTDYHNTLIINPMLRSSFLLWSWFWWMTSAASLVRQLLRYSIFLTGEILPTLCTSDLNRSLKSHLIRSNIMKFILSSPEFL